MLVAIHQPHYLPWLRYFEKLARADVFIVLDDVQYEKNGYQNRNRIKTPQGDQLLTVPVQRPTQAPIREVRVDDRSGWREKHRRAIEQSYARAPYFAEYWPRLRPFYEAECERLGELNSGMLRTLAEILGVSTRLVWSSEIPTKGQSTERLAELCLAVEGDAYLSGAYAVQAYLDPDVLANAGIRLLFQEWRAPEYSQLYPKVGFVRDLSILDLLFNEGPASLSILLNAGGVADPATPDGG